MVATFSQETHTNKDTNIYDNVVQIVCANTWHGNSTLWVQSGSWVSMSKILFSVGESNYPAKIVHSDLCIVFSGTEQILSVGELNPGTIHREQYQPVPTESNCWYHSFKDSTNC